MHFCLQISEDKKGYELISNSTLVSIYLFFWNLVYDLIKGYFDVNSNSLLIIQIIISSIICFIFFIIILLVLIHSIISGYLFYLFFLFLSFFLLGGFWLSPLCNCLDYYNLSCNLYGLLDMNNMNQNYNFYCRNGKLICKGAYCDNNNMLYSKCCLAHCYETRCCDCCYCCKWC